jgi:uncharacterized protein (DUF58 family)
VSAFKARLRRWFRPPRRFRLTREGKWFIGATLVLGFAAVNGGINLLFLMFGMLLCLLVANGVISEAAMRRLAVHRQLPAAIHAGSPFLVGISVHNHKAKIATFSLEVEDLAAGGKPVDRRCFFLKIPAGRQQETSYRRTLPRRGLHRLVGLRLSTRFPFGLLRRSIDVDSAVDLLVYPALIPATAPALASGLAQLGEQQSLARARSGDFHGLRELRPGDDPRDIHWRTSARRGRPFVREFEEESGRHLIIVLETGRDFPTDDFESAVSYAASLALVLLRQAYRVGLSAGPTLVPPALGPAQAGSILRCLALVDGNAPGTRDRQALAGAILLTVTPAPGHPKLVVSKPQTARRSA